MPTTYSPNLSLPVPAVTDQGWGATLNQIFALLDALSVVYAGYVRPTESPSTTLNVQIGSGAFIDSAGNRLTFAGTSSVALTPSATTSIYLDDAGTLVYSTTGFPTGVQMVQLAVVTTSGTAVTSVVDMRMPLGAAKT